MTERPAKAEPIVSRGPSLGNGRRQLYMSEEIMRGPAGIRVLHQDVPKGKEPKQK